MVRVHVWISGRVQGVSFRYYTEKRARKLGLAGWVRNLKDGRVEAVFQGPQDKVDEMLDWCKKGPSLAKVSDVKIKNEEVKDIIGFSRRETV